MGTKTLPQGAAQEISDDELMASCLQFLGDDEKHKIHFNRTAVRRANANFVNAVVNFFGFRSGGSYHDTIHASGIDGTRKADV